jgi:hypothetical protein
MSHAPKAAGLLKGTGTATSDSIPAKLSKGEYVIPAAVVKHYGINYFKKLTDSVDKQPGAVSTVKKGMPHMAGGGPVMYSPEERKQALDLQQRLKPQPSEAEAEAALKKNYLAQPGTPIGKQVGGALNTLGQAAIDDVARPIKAVASGIDFIRDTANTNPSSMRLDPAGPKADSLGDAQDFVSRKVIEPVAGGLRAAGNTLYNTFNGETPVKTQGLDNAIGGLRAKAVSPVTDKQPIDFIDTARDFTSRNIIEPVLGAFKDNDKPSPATKTQQQSKPQQQPVVKAVESEAATQQQSRPQPVDRNAPITAKPVVGIDTPSALNFDNGRKTLAGQGYSLSSTNRRLTPDVRQSTPESLTALDKTIAYNAKPETKAMFAREAQIVAERAARNQAAEPVAAPQQIQPQTADYSGAINDAQAQLNWLAQTGPMGNSHSDKKAHQQQLAAAQAQLASLMGLQGGSQEQGLGMARLSQAAQQQAESNALARQQLQYGMQRDQQTVQAAAEQQNYERQRNQQSDNKLIAQKVKTLKPDGNEVEEVKFFNPLTGEEVLSPQQQQDNKNTQISTNAHDIINNPDNPAHKDPAKVARAKAWFETPAGKTWLAANAQ